MDVTSMPGKLVGYYLAEQYRKNAATGTSESMSFAELAAAKVKQQGWGVTENSSLVNYYARKIYAKVAKWKTDYDRWDRAAVASLGPRAQEIVAKPWEISYCLVLDEEGEVKQSCVFDATGGKLIGPSEEEVRQFKAEQAAKRKRREKYARLNEESALKRKLLEVNMNKKKEGLLWMQQD